jgi:hypothetical protein
MWVLFVLAVVGLLFIFPRQMVRILGASAVVAAAVGGFFFWEKYQREQQVEAVQMSVSYDPVACSADKPLRVSVDNGAKYAVAQLKWVFSARRPGYRASLTGDWLNEHTAGEVIAAGEQWVGCYPAPQPRKHAAQRDTDDPAKLELGIRSRQVVFAE